MKKLVLFVVVILLAGSLYKFEKGRRTQAAAAAAAAAKAVPKPVAAVGLLSAGTDHVLAVNENADIYGWGSNQSQALGLGRQPTVPVPTRLSSGMAVGYVYAGRSASYAITTSNRLLRRPFSSVDCRHTECGVTSYSWFYPEMTWRWVKEAWGLVAAIDTEDNLWVWREPVSRLERPEDVKRVQVSPQNRWKDVCIGTDKIYAVAVDGSLWKYEGRFPDARALGERGLALSPVKIEARLEHVYCRDQAEHVLALDTAGRLWGFGTNTHSELGDGDGDRFTPSKPVAEAQMKQVSDKHWIDIAVGPGFTLGVAADGSLWGWGLNSFGQTGAGEQSGHDRPTLVDRTRVWVAVVAGFKFGAALTRDGEIYTWGENTAGVLGDGGAAAMRTTPTRIFDSQRWAVATAEGS